ncbi:glycosyltransferase [Spirosoma harenae]
MKVYIDPLSNIDYTAFYIKGLYDVFGESNVGFSSQYFQGLKQTKAIKFTICNSNIIHRYVIDWSDDSIIEDMDYDWCDVYGKINFNAEKTPAKYHQKITQLAPSFGIKLWSKLHSGLYGLQNLFRAQKKYTDIKSFLSSYYKQSKQVSLDYYSPGTTIPDYIYSVNTLWASDQWINNDETVNLYRANFMNACMNFQNLHFEGGFVYSKIKNLNPCFQHLIIKDSWVPKEVYINKIKASTLVFNTPAWALCHGWKLGEYLALGKAIISTPLINQLPEPLEHGKHIHIVSGSEADISAAIELIVENVAYRQSLESNARDYYLNYVSPTRSIKILLQKYQNEVFQEMN